MELLRQLRDYRGTHLLLAALFSAASAAIVSMLNMLATGSIAVPPWAVPLIPIAGIFGYGVRSALDESAKEERLQAVEDDAVMMNQGGATAALYRAPAPPSIATVTNIVPPA